MSDIDSLIKRSRSRGGFKKKGYFKLAYQKAKTKVAEYALPDRHFYCLEFIQSAVALNATFVDIATKPGTCIISFVGAHYDKQDLEYLFDFLLTTRQEDHFRARRRLAIGIAAALSKDGSRIVVETGDGTPDGSYRLEMTSIEETAMIGAPKKPISGTFIRVTGASSFGSSGMTPEDHLIEARCLDMPIPLQLNGNVLTGYSTSKAMLFRHYQCPVAIDEGTLYGGIGFNYRNPDSQCELKILTNGIWVTSIKPNLPDGIEGVVGYERLHKTASQYDIVNDDRMIELVERLKPYVDSICEKLEYSEKRRLNFLINRQAPEPAGIGKPWSVNLKNESDKHWGSLRLWLSSKENEGLSLNVLDAKRGLKRVDHVRLLYPLQLTGELKINMISLKDIHFRSPGQPWYHERNVVGLKHDFYQSFLQKLEPFAAKINAHFEEQRKKLEEKANVSLVEVEATPAPVPEPTVEEESESISEEMYVDKEELEGLNEELDMRWKVLSGTNCRLGSEQRQTAEPDPVAAVADEALAPINVADKEEETEERARSASPRRAKPLPGFKQIRRFVEKAGEDCEPVVTDLLSRVLNHSRMAFMSSGRIWWDEQVSFEEQSPDGPMALANRSFGQVDEEDLLGNSFNIVINTGHPSVSRWMSEIAEHPEGLYFLALAAIDAVRGVTTETELSDHEIMLHNKVLRVLYNEISRT
ncbi:MAG: hypothetical protein GY854_03550 [Deltaproteobacteria bacterium]|nr:hypothetical protein [Deltaproteobacteria bacterium]